MNSRTVIPATTGDGPVPVASMGRRPVPRRTHGVRFALGLAVPPLVWQLAFFIGPLLVLIAMTFWSVKMFRLTPDMVLSNWTHLLNASFFKDAYIYTFWVAALSAILAGVLALPVSYTLARKVSPFTQRLAMLLLIVTFFTSYPVRIYAWQIVFSPNGIINSVLALVGMEPVIILNTTTATVVGFLTLVMPLVILIQTFAIASVDQRLIEAAYNLGCSHRRTLFTVLFPSARIGLILAGTFAFVLSFGDYISPALLGGSRPPTLSILLTDQVKSGNHWPRAAVVAVVMILTLLTVVLSMLALAYRKKGAAA